MLLRQCSRCLRFLRQKKPLIEHRRWFILGIETSCDDTGAAVIDTSGQLLGEAISTQKSTRFGGVIPTFAMVFHKDKIEEVVTKALNEAGVRIEDASAIAVTNRPGLKGPLIIGTDYAKYLCTKYNKPMIPVHHMVAHALTVRMENRVDFPFVFLLISGGHCLLGLAKDVDDFSILGSSKDDSPGETLDKVARRLKVHTLPNLRDVSGGRAVEILAQNHDPMKIKFGVPLKNERDCNFSFAGLKGHLELHLSRLKIEDDRADEVVPQVGDLCAGVQYTLTKHLCERLQRGLEYLEYEEILKGGTLVVSGGVASNQFIRSSLSTVCEKLGWRAVYPRPKLCTDNGVMIAWTGLELWRLGRDIVPPNDVLDVEVFARCPMGESIADKVKEAHLKCKFVPIM